jgi:predicted dehydrogenase
MSRAPSVGEPTIEDMVRLAILGAAHIHLFDAVDVAASRSDVSVETVYDRDIRRADRWARTLGASSTTSPAEALENVDACLVYSEPSQHGRLAAEVHERSLPCLMEEPLALTGKDALAVARTVPAAQVGFFLRYWPALAALRSCLQDGHIGRPGEVSVRFVHDGLARGWFDGEYRWMRSSREGGGGFFDLAGHCVDAASWILGRDIVVTDVDLTGTHHGEARLVEGSGVKVHVEAGAQLGSTRASM